MLETLHNASKSWIVRILFAVLILSFVSWGGLSDIFNKITADGTAAEVGSQSVTMQELARDFEREVKRLRPLFGNKLTSQQAVELGVLDKTLNQIVARKLYQQEANRLGLSVGESELKKTIYSIPAFQDENGKFDKALYQMTLSNNGLSEAEFLQLLRGDIVRGQLLNAVSGGVPIPGTLIDQMFAFRAEKRVADLLVAEASAMPAPPAPSQEELSKFHQTNADKFTAPETRAVSVLYVTQDSLAEESKPSDADVEESFRVRAQEFTTPEKRIVLQMLFDNADKAKEAANRLKSGEDFNKVAKELAGMDEQATLLGRIERRDLPGELSPAVFALPKDGVTEPLKSAIGWHVLKVTGVTPPAPKPFAEVKAQIALELAQENAGKALSTLSAQIIDEVAGGANLDEAAKKYHVKLEKYGPLTAQGRDAQGNALKKLPAPDKLLELAFTTPEGADSQVIELDDGILGLRVEKVTPSALKPLDSVKDQVKNLWSDEEKRKTAQERAAKALEKLKAGASFSSLAQELGLKTRSTTPFARDAQPNEVGLPPKLIADMFNSRPGEASMATMANGAIVARLGKIVTADPKEGGELRFEVAQGLEQSLTGDLIDQFTAALAANYGVEKHEAAIHKYFNQP